MVVGNADPDDDDNDDVQKLSYSLPMPPFRVSLESKSVFRIVDPSNTLSVGVPEARVPGRLSGDFFRKSGDRLLSFFVWLTSPCTRYPVEVLAIDSQSVQQRSVGGVLLEYSGTR